MLQHIFISKANIIKNHKYFNLSWVVLPPWGVNCDTTLKLVKKIDKNECVYKKTKVLDREV